MNERAGLSVTVVNWDAKDRVRKCIRSISGSFGMRNET
jgi:hypothetical protein